MISVMAVAGVFVMAAGQIDLTVGAVTAMTAMLVSLVLQATNSILLALVTGLGFGVVIGCINGLLVTKLKLPAWYHGDRKRCCHVDHQYRRGSHWK